MLDEVRIYNRALSAGEVSALYKRVVNVTVTPNAPTLGAGQSLSFTAGVTGAANTAVTWSLPDPASGSITTSGLYTAPGSIPFPGVVYHISATSQADINQSSTVPVVVGLALQVEPQEATMPTLGSQSFTVTGPGQTSPSVRITDKIKLSFDVWENRIVPRTLEL